MTAASTVEPAARVRPDGPGGRALGWAATVLGLLTAVVRMALIPRSFDLFGDEVIYADLGHSVTHGGFPRLQGPFFLHGPAFFYLEAGWIHLAGPILSSDTPFALLSRLAATQEKFGKLFLGSRCEWGSIPLRRCRT